jgi:hypothetical protein
VPALASVAIFSLTLLILMDYFFANERSEIAEPFSSWLRTPH